MDKFNKNALILFELGQLLIENLNFYNILDFGRKDVQNKKGKTVCRFVV